MNQNLPSFVVIAPHLPYAGTQVWANDFLPGLSPGHARRARARSRSRTCKRRTQRAEACRSWSSDLAERAQPASTWQRSGNDSELAARIRSFETAFHMQFEAPEAFDLVAGDRRDAASCTA